jgi:hypothetical protein
MSWLLLCTLVLSEQPACQSGACALQLEGSCSTSAAEWLFAARRAR